MDWAVVFVDAFVAEFKGYPETVQDAIAARIRLLEREGPQLGRPHADTLMGSKHANMKELRCNAGVEFGGLPSLLTPIEKPFFWRLETNRE